ncbi:hypothetical protein B0H14DRAFT_3430119 [Mycena olivaceomarginata]|nr:hypothetical protein B0H14DRAFT_3430119 [Mycena olivaceomarginata]
MPITSPDYLLWMWLWRALTTRRPSPDPPSVIYYSLSQLYGLAIKLRLTRRTIKLHAAAVAFSVLVISTGQAPVNGSEIIIHVELNNLSPVFNYFFRLKSVDPGPVMQISMAKVNQALPGLGFHYISFQADGSTTFQQKLARAPYPQEIALSPMLSFHPEMDLRLCLYRRRFYIWPMKSLVKCSPVAAAEVHELLSVGPAEGIEHTFAETPEVTIRLHMHMQNSKAILDQSAKVVSRRTRLLERLGRSRGLLENVAQIFSPASEMHPIAKAITQGLGQIYNKLVELEDWDDKLLELISDMAAFLDYVDNIKTFATMAHFKTNLQNLEPIIIRTGNLILKYSVHGLSFQTEMAEYNTLKHNFERWTEQFRNYVGVESLKWIGRLQEMMEDQRAFFEKDRTAIVDRLRPPGMDRRRSIPGCLKGTRTRIFEKIDVFLADRSSPNILWIKGFPGSGKSCIARSVVDKLVNTTAPRFGASFFFERDNGAFTAPSTMLRSISSDLCKDPVFLDALSADSQAQAMDFSTASIEDQFRQLIEKPLQHVVDKLQDGDALVVVLDALDECGGFAKSRSQDLWDVLAVAQRWSTLSPSLRLVITSRVEKPISEVLGPISTPLNLKLSSRQATRDIEEFLALELRKIGTTYCLPDWPTSEEIKALAAKAKGLFVWAATLVNFLNRPRPQDPLGLILKGEVNVEGDITKLYNLILDISFCSSDYPPSPRFFAEFNAFVGAIVTARRPLERRSPLFTIIDLEPSTAEYICEKLRSVMVSGSHLRFNHQSFVDFILSEGCPPIFRIIPSESKRATSLALLNFLNNHLRFDPSHFGTSHHSNHKTQPHVSAELSFACQYWSDTLPVLKEREDYNILSSLTTFLENNLLFWLEALSLTSQMACARVRLLDAKKSIGTLDLHLGALVADAVLFVEIFQQCMSKSAPHVYLSAMAFTPQSSKIYQTYSPLLQPCASLIIQTADALRHGRSAVPAPIVYLPNGDEIGDSFEGHVDGILSTLFIQDGYVASASYDGTVRFWNPESGTPVLMPFTNHPSSKAITSLAFSNDRMLLVGGSRDGDADAVTCVALSPMGTICITGCKNGTVAFWDIQSRQECRTPFRGHTERVTAVIFLEDGVAVSGSEDKLVYIHHISGHSEILVRAQKLIYSLAMVMEPRILVAASYSCITVWNLSDKNVPSDAIYLAQNSQEIESVAVNGTHIAAGVGKRIEIWDYLTRKRVLEPLAGHTKAVTSVAFSPDGRRLVSSSIDRSKAPK